MNFATTSIEDISAKLYLIDCSSHRYCAKISLGTIKDIHLKEISSFKPEHRILSLIDYLKKEEGISEHEKFEVSLTRQHLADLTGLRVETVIRSVKTLEKEGSLKLIGHKIYR